MPVMKCGQKECPNYEECPGIQVHQITGNACVGVMQVGKQAEEEVQRRIKDAEERWSIKLRCSTS